MTKKNPFKWRHFQAEIILLCVRWYLRYPISYRHVAEMMLDRGLGVCHTTIYRWVQRFAPELDKRCRPHVRLTYDSWRVDETYIKVKGRWKYLYRAIDSQGKTLDFLLTAKRDAKAAKRFLVKALKANHTVAPRVINVDKDAAYPKAFKELQDEGTLPKATTLRRVKYMNDIIEADHRSVKRLTRPMMGFQNFHTAGRTLRGMEIMSIIRKGQTDRAAEGDVVAQAKFIEQIFGIEA